MWLRIGSVTNACHPEPPKASEPKAERRKTAKDLNLPNLC